MVYGGGLRGYRGAVWGGVAGVAVGAECCGAAVGDGRGDGWDCGDDYSFADGETVGGAL